MLADPLMKYLPPNIFEEHVDDMGLLESLGSWTGQNKATNSRFE
jgi:hypothetical protein